MTSARVSGLCAIALGLLTVALLLTFYAPR